VRVEKCLSEYVCRCLLKCDRGRVSLAEAAIIEVRQEVVCKVWQEAV